MKKDYREWNLKKKALHNEGPRFYCAERDIWFSHLGENIGHEQDGRGADFLRPVVILKQFNTETCWVIPLARPKRLHPVYHFEFSFIISVKSAALLNQLRLIDVKRLKHKAGVMNKNDFLEMKNKIRRLLA